MASAINGATTRRATRAIRSKVVRSMPAAPSAEAREGDNGLRGPDCCSFDCPSLTKVKPRHQARTEWPVSDLVTQAPTGRACIGVVARVKNRHPLVDRVEYADRLLIASQPWRHEASWTSGQAALSAARSRRVLMQCGQQGSPDDARVR